ncbi:lytic transglycosylase domain-containing protein [Pseudomonas sp. LS1212]|uniref:lytic transglycosylase domain-containing protein n=1 Tax=Pseudomonas sp. LS1212 TaxID=2972478 RepID=UPI00215D1882|nr:lytic transglycosylase domain-containing protein [Pseudomonas sp. LS1212]UVJ41937.1 lytic transglycosylase domain-containing protein [Pseudomonas sp. LS1212]
MLISGCLRRWRAGLPTGFTCKPGQRKADESFAINDAVPLQLPAALLHAVIQAESRYNPKARSDKGAAGLMQLMPGTARELGVSNVLDPASNIQGGARYLKRLMVMFDNDMALALAAYNAGPAAVLRRGRVIPPFSETQRYVPSVLRTYRALQGLAPDAPL